MMNNYFHDVATALLLASGIAIWVIYKKLGGSDEPGVRAYFLRLYDSLTFLAKFSLAWIILGGIPRTYFYTEFEWSHYAVTHHSNGNSGISHHKAGVFICSNG